VEAYNRIANFISTAIVAIDANKDADLLREEQRIYVKTHVSKIKVEPQVKSCERGSSVFVRPALSPIKSIEFIEKFICNTPEAEAVATYLSSEYTIPLPRIKHLLFEMCRDILKYKLSESNIDHSKLALTLILDLEDAPIKWDVQVGINGVYLNSDEEIVLSNGVSVRSPRPEDLEKEHDIYDSFALSRGQDAYGFPSAYLCMTTKAKTRKDVELRVKVFFKILSLYKVASISRQSLRFIPESFREHSLVIDSPESSKGTFYSYKLIEDHFEIFREIIPSLEVLVTKVLVDCDESWKPLFVAFQRYSDACAAVEIEEQITLCITCLEALYLKKTERDELSHRLAQRCARLLSSFHPKPTIKIYENIKKAYEIRSNFIHGSSIEKNNNNYSKDLAHDVLECGRLSLLVFILSISSIEKDALLSKIDNSLLDENAYEILKTKIIANVNIPKQ